MGTKSHLQIAREIKKRNSESNKKWNPNGFHNEGVYIKGIINGEYISMTSRDWSIWWIDVMGEKRNETLVRARSNNGWTDVAASMAPIGFTKIQAEKLARKLTGQSEKIYSDEEINKIRNNWLSGARLC